MLSALPSLTCEVAGAGGTQTKLVFQELGLEDEVAHEAEDSQDGVVQVEHPHWVGEEALQCFQHVC